MEITKAQFIKGIAGTDPILQDDIPHIAFIGRSNVGKSSLINSLVRSKDLVATSSTPGKTKRINFFKINDAYYFVDLPGYGFASRDHALQQKLREWISWYLQTDEVKQKKVVVVLDSQVGVTPFDDEILTLLEKQGTETVIVANKIDKLSQSEHAKLIRNLQESYAGSRDVRLVPYSTKTGRGREILLKMLFPPSSQT